MKAFLLLVFLSFTLAVSAENSTATLTRQAVMFKETNPFSERLFTIPVGTSVKIIAEVGAFYRVEYQEQVGYINRANFAEATPPPTRIIDENCGEDAEIIINTYILDRQAEFPGGMNAMHRFLWSNIRFPIYALERCIQGTVFGTLVVECDGRISNIEITRSVHQVLDDEFIRVLKLMPIWNPGTLNGKPVRVQVNMPMRFTLEGDCVPTVRERERNRRR